MRRLIAALLISLAGVLVPTPAGGTTELSPAVYEQRIVRHVNEARAKHGLRPVRQSRCLSYTSRQHMSRLDSQPVTLWHSNLLVPIYLCDEWMVGETLAEGKIWPARTVKLWMHSPGHRAVLMRANYDTIGVSAVKVGDVWLIVAQFGDRL